MKNCITDISNRKRATILGVLFVIVIVLHTIGSSIMEEFLLSPDYLSSIYKNTTLVIIAELLELIATIAIIGIVVMTYPIIKEYDEKIARNYAVFRLIEIVMLIVGVIIAFSLLSLSHEYVNAGSPDSGYKTRGALLLEGRYWSFKVVLIFLLLGYLILFYSLYQTKLIPRFISIWGLIIVPLMFTGILLEIFVSSSFGNSVFFPGFVIFYLPGAPLDLVLGIWLIIKGFNEDSIASGSVKTDINDN